MRLTSLTFLLFSCLLLFFAACQADTTDKNIADTILTNGNFYTLDETQPRADAVAIKDGDLIFVGTNEAAQAFKGDSTKVRDLQGAFAMPGFIEGHGHFHGLGESLMNLNFLKSKNWDEIVAQVAAAAEKAKPGEWITGRGWHQEKWNESPEKQVLGYPFHDALSAVSPDNPVVLRHASGHGLFANEKAMSMAGVNKEMPSPSGGEIVRDAAGEAIGVFEERAMSVIMKQYNDYLSTLTEEEKAARWQKAIELAEAECLENGITSFQDAGSSYFDVENYTALAEKGELDLRLWSMLRHSSERLTGNLDGFPIIDKGDRFYTCRAIKTEVDGALGSFGAWLLKSYNDKPNFTGQNTTTVSEVKAIAELAKKAEMQLCVHAIGDRANQVVLNIMEESYADNPEILQAARWRIEHAQHLDTADIPRFKEMGIIASMQGIHCTSDAPFVEARLGEERSRLGAYPWRSLLDQGVVIANGTDAPVEDVSALESLYASVTRKRADTGFEFFPEQRMTRAEAIHSYTLGNAYAGFEEEYKGSLEVGKVADIVVLSNDLLTCADEEILTTDILITMVDGVVKYEN
ncbi:MAG: amidohydrolase [Saprospiraceae bacterium]